MEWLAWGIVGVARSHVIIKRESAVENIAVSELTSNGRPVCHSTCHKTIPTRDCTEGSKAPSSPNPATPSVGLGTDRSCSRGSVAMRQAPLDRVATQWTNMDHFDR